MRVLGFDILENRKKGKIHIARRREEEEKKKKEKITIFDLSTKTSS